MYIDSSSIIHKKEDDTFNAKLLKPISCTQESDGHCVRFQLRIGAYVVAACSGNGNELLHRQKTPSAIFDCTNVNGNARLVERVSAGTSQSNICHRCKKDLVASFNLLPSIDLNLKVFEMTMQVFRVKKVLTKVKVLDGVLDSNWNVLISRTVIDKNTDKLKCSHRWEDFRLDGFPGVLANTYGDDNWPRSVMLSTCGLNEGNHHNVLNRLFGSRTSWSTPKGSDRLVRGHLTANADMIFKFQQHATFTYVNAAPQWQKTNGQIWLQVEEKVRKIAFENQADLEVATGTFGTLELLVNCDGGTVRNRDANNNLILTKVTTLSTVDGRIYRVPKIFYKIVCPPKSDCQVIVNFNTLQTASQLYNDDVLLKTLLSNNCKPVPDKPVVHNSPFYLICTKEQFHVSIQCSNDFKPRDVLNLLPNF
jgi:DNA/RNA non-specific endonuclease